MRKVQEENFGFVRDMGKVKTRTAFPYSKCKRAVKSMHHSAPYGFHQTMHFDVAFDMPSSYCKDKHAKMTEVIKDKQHLSSEDESLRLLFVHHLQPGAFIQSYDFRDNKRILTQHEVGYKSKYYYDNKSQFSEQLAEESPPSNFAIEVLMDKPIPTFSSSSSSSSFSPSSKESKDQCSVDLNFRILMHLRYQMAVFDNTTHKPVNISTPEIYMAHVDNKEFPFVSSLEYFNFFPTEESSLFLNEKYVYIDNNQYKKITNCIGWDKLHDKINPKSSHAIETLYVPVADARDFDFIVLVTDITYFCTGTSLLIMLCYHLFQDIRRSYMRYREKWLIRRALEKELKDKDE